MRPAEQLTGLTLSNGWKVIALATRSPTATGGCFSTGYLVENADGRKGFLKAMDYIFALSHSDTPAIMKLLADAYLFEKSICDRCRNSKLSRVVHAIDSGSILPTPGNPAFKVEYLIFERADGDIRAHLDAQRQFDVAFALRTIHNVATALAQLHNADIAHQDLKPSNILVFPSTVGSKIGDLGRAWAKGLAAPHDGYTIAGDPGYAPPELIYNNSPLTEAQRRFGCDLYHLGSMIFFLFTRVHANGMLVKHLSRDHYPDKWGGTYVEVIPYLQAAFGQAVSELRAQLPEPIREEICLTVIQLCEPDPAKRGHPLNREGHVNQFSLERYISRFDFLAKKMELAMIGGGL